MQSWYNFSFSPKSCAALNNGFPDINAVLTNNMLVPDKAVPRDEEFGQGCGGQGSSRSGRVASSGEEEGVSQVGSGGWGGDES